MFCRKCGATLNDDSAFCTKCGTAVQEVKNDQAVSELKDIIATNDGKRIIVKKATPGRRLGITSLVLGVIALIFAFLCVTDAFVSDAVDEVYSEQPISSTVFEDGKWKGPSVEAGVNGSELIMICVTLACPVFAAVAIKRGYKNGISIAGLVLGIVAVSCDFIAIIISVANNQ